MRKQSNNSRTEVHQGNLKNEEKAQLLTEILIDLMIIYDLILIERSIQELYRNKLKNKEAL